MYVLLQQERIQGQYVWRMDETIKYTFDLDEAEEWKRSSTFDLVRLYVLATRYVPYGTTRSML